MKGKNKISSRRMQFFMVSLILLFRASLMFAQQDKEVVSSIPTANTQWVLVVHGGAGGPPKGTFKPEEEQAYLDNLDQAMMKGASILEKGGNSLDAVEAVVRFLEDCPLFNAGKGAVLSDQGIAELDASIMDGKTLRAGAVAGVTTIKNPVSAARKVMENSPHVMLIDGGAESFAKDQGLEIVDPSYFITDKIKEKWEKSRNKDPKPENRKGTVGAVALDQYGNLAAATSTGGMMNKMHGRVGDSPIIGAGTYANNKTCAVSCTGHGEYFIRNVVAFDVSVRMEYQGLTLEESANKVIWEKLKPQGGDGGLIAVDRNGQIAMPYNSNAMFRGYIRADGQKKVLIY